MKKATITCKVCGGEHMGMICTKYKSVRVLDPPARKTAIAGLLAAPKPEKPKAKKKVKKAKKKKRTKNRTPGPATTTQPTDTPAIIDTVVADIQPDKSKENP